MSDVITKPGPHRERSNGKAKVDYIDTSTGWAFGYDSNARATAWHCETGRAVYGFSIAGEWKDPPAFSVGDLVLVDCPTAAGVHQHYGYVEKFNSRWNPDTIGVRMNDTGISWFKPSELKPVTLPAPLPAGYRLKPRNVLAVAGDIGTSRVHAPSWIDVADNRSWIGRTCREFDATNAGSAPYFFAEPIPVPEPPTPPEGFEIKPRDYVGATGVDQIYLSGNDARWCLIEGAVSSAHMDQTWPRHAPHYIASPIPLPFRISTHGCGVYETRDGREATVKFDRDNLEFRWLGIAGNWGEESWRDGGEALVSRMECARDLVRYLRPLSSPEPRFKVGDRVRWKSDADVASWIRGQRGVVVALTPVFTVSRDGTPYATNIEYVELDAEPQPQWTPTCELRLKPDGGNGPPRLRGLCHNGYGQNYVLQQRWTSGDREEWRAVEVVQ